MQKAIIAFLSLSVLVSCISIPVPENESDSLVTGNIVWDFPDGLFQGPPRTFNSGFNVVFVNLTTGIQFRIRTTDGYFNFKSNGTDKFMLQVIELKDPNPSEKFSIYHTMNLQFTSKPKSILYVGEIFIVYASPEPIKAKEGNSIIWTTYRFREKYDISYKPDDLKKYLAGFGKNAWTDYPVVRLYE
jgi:hypothetical protein